MYFKSISKNMTIFIFLFCFFIITTTYAQEESKTNHIGISASFQSSQLDFLLPIFMSKSFILAPSFSFVYVQDVLTDFSFGLIPKIYLSDKKVRPFVDFRLGILVNSLKEEKNTTDFVWGGGFGGEYFIDNNFSIGIETQLNFSNSDSDSRRFGNPGGLNINTATAIFATIYF